MFNISIYLNKFKTIESKNSFVKKNIINSINNVLKTKLNNDDFTIKNNTIYLKVNSVVKSEIFINKVFIEKELNNKNIKIKGIF